MFGNFLKSLTQPDPQPLNDGDARLALTALLVRLARTDGDYAPAEIERIDRISKARYGLDDAGAAELRTQAETLESEAPDTVRFTRAIKDAVPYDHRIGVIEALWSVALADGDRDQDENALMRMVASFLGVSDVDSAMARQRMAKK
ncbi:Tellurite resistance protein TerB [Roseovarius albus]|uniref:Tellurite resistance protein TerB n=1 Tax=Roseovarius albus TaxID=1247867 RepID=A0A1X6Y4W4_9RHOB|nr:TerB family tellurite resistance protein [Roseovarius albus]SLN10801.1 Tellurite resistance protein TerB [Roseovarius albus]